MPRLLPTEKSVESWCGTFGPPARGSLGNACGSEVEGMKVPQGDAG